MNKTVKDFFEKNGVDYLTLSGEKSSMIYSKGEINNLVAKSSIFKESIKDSVCIDEILGYDYKFYGDNNNIVMSLSNFFDENGTTYQQRSVSMLHYSSEEVVKGLENSFIIEPMVVDEVESNKYVISRNGLHRYSLLKTHYMIEMSKAVNDEQRELIRKKYTIPVSINKLDRIKTYSNFILAKLDEKREWLSAEYDNNYKLTGNSCLETRDKKIILSDEQLILYVRSVFESLDNETTQHFLNYYCDLYSEFREYVELYLSDYLKNKGVQRKK